MPAFVIGVLIGIGILKAFGPGALYAIVGAIQGTTIAIILYAMSCLVWDIASFQRLGIVALVGCVGGGVTGYIRNS